MSVVVVSTGGTIASRASAPDEGASPELSGADLVESVPDLRKVAEIRTREFSNVPSPHFTVEQMHSLTGVVRELAAEGGVEGVVVTQGTDVLEETAYFVDLCYDDATPVVFTGAMRTPSSPGADGPRNLLAAVRTAASDAARDRGVLVAFGDRVYPAREVTKAHSMATGAFRAPEFGPLAVLDEDRLTWRRTAANPDPTFTPARERLTNDVYAVTVTADMPPSQVAAASSADAVCLAATGAGHVPPGIIDPLEALREQGVPVVATTRCPEGRLARHTYGFEGSEATLRELGCYYSDLNLQKTRVKTIVALAAGKLDAAFDRPGARAD